MLVPNRAWDEWVCTLHKKAQKGNVSTIHLTDVRDSGRNNIAIVL